MDYYSYILVFHIMSFVAWMAVLFYLPRLFVYHTENKDNSGFVSVVKIQQKKLYKYIGIPSLVGTYLTGLGMIAINPSIMSSGGWMHAKLTVVAFLTIYFFSLGSYIKKLYNGRFDRSGRFFRIYNEVPTLFAFVIVLMVIVKPF